VKLIRKRLTYANVMSSIAVFLILGGATAFAAKKIGSNEIKGNSITTGKIKKEAVTASKIKNNSIITSKIADNAVTTAKIANGSVTGAKLNLGTVGTVPNAAHAINADTANNSITVGGLTIKKFSVKVPSGAGETTVLSVGGITLTGSCVGGATSLTASKDAGAPSMTATMAAFNTAASELKTTGFSSFSSIDLDQGLSTLGGKLETTTSTGNVTTIQYQARDAGNFTPNENVCVYAGSAISG
jgi:hypothetical protein